LQEDHPLAEELRALFAQVYAPPAPQPANEGFKPLQPGSLTAAGRFQIAFSASNGGISDLVDTLTGQTWANSTDGSNSE
jgi:hypothetical protein